MNTLLLGVRVLLFALSTFGYLTVAAPENPDFRRFSSGPGLYGQICVSFSRGF